MSQFNVTNLKNVAKFDGSYFHVWKHNLQSILQSKKLSNFVDGSELKPIMPPPTPGQSFTHTPRTRPASKAKWDEKDIQARIIIRNCLELNQISHIISKQTFKESWDELCWLYEAQDSVTQMYLKEQLTTFKMKNNDSVTKHNHIQIPSRLVVSGRNSFK